MNFRLLILALAAALALSGQEIERLEAQGYLSDFARVVDADSRSAINAYLAALEAATGAQVAIVTVPSLSGQPIEEAANTLFRRWGVGQKKTNEGALFLFAIRDRKSRLEVGYGLEEYLPDGVAGSILRAMRPALRQGQYGPAMREAARQLGERIAAGKNVKLPDTLDAPGSMGPRQGEEEPDAMILLIFLAILLLAFVWRVRRNRRRGVYAGTPWFFPGGGGFGGSHSGGGSSWGGFGGGDSGGGGASSDW